MSRSNNSNLFLIVLLAITLIIPTIHIANAEPGWLDGWDKRVKITIDHGDIDGALSDFPVLIYLSNSSGINNDDLTFVFDEVGANSLKIAVTEDDGITECYVEVEKWDSGNEKAWLWSKIQSISNIVDTDIYLYYDNDHADNNAHVGVTNSLVAENVWDDDFLMVQHQAGEASPIRDSTSNDIDMASTGNPAYQQSGPIDGTIDYDGDDDHVSSVDVFDAIFGADKGTIGLWIKTTQTMSVDRYAFSIEGALALMFKGAEGGLMTGFWTGTRADAVTTTTDINTGVWHYVVTTYDGVNQRIYVAGLQEDIDACNLYDITGLTRNSRISAQWDGSMLLSAVIDDVRVSKISRPSAWIFASYEAGRDDLLVWGSEESILPPSIPDLLFGAGFNATSPYVELHWNHSLVGVTLFEVQNSSDRVSWTYLGQSIMANYTDSQVVNGTERYYRVRACNQTGGEWYNSSWTDVNFETVHFIPEIGDGDFVCIPQFFNASSIEVIVGTLNDGNLASTYFVDGDWYNISEVTGPPGLDVRVNFTGVELGCGCFEFFQTFIGHPHHDIEVQIWNFTSTSWKTIGPIFFNETANWACIGLGHNYTHFFDGGNLYARFYHEGVGHAGHELQIDRIDLGLVQVTECLPADGAPVDATPYLGIGIILALAMILLADKARR